MRTFTITVPAVARAAAATSDMEILVRDDEDGPTTAAVRVAPGGIWMPVKLVEAVV